MKRSFEQFQSLDYPLFACLIAFWILPGLLFSINSCVALENFVGKLADGKTDWTLECLRNNGLA